MYMRIFYVALSLATVSSFAQAQHGSERFSIGINDVNNVFRTELVLQL